MHATESLSSDARTRRYTQRFFHLTDMEEPIEHIDGLLDSDDYSEDDDVADDDVEALSVDQLRRELIRERTARRAAEARVAELEHGMAAPMPVPDATDGARKNRLVNKLPKQRQSCQTCHEGRLRCVMTPSGKCEQCIARGWQCVKVLEKKRGRPRLDEATVRERAAKRAQGLAPSTQQLANSCETCHEGRLRCVMTPSGTCEQCIARGFQCVKRLAKKRGRPRLDDAARRERASNLAQVLEPDVGWAPLVPVPLDAAHFVPSLPADAVRPAPVSVPSPSARTPPALSSMEPTPATATVPMPSGASAFLSLARESKALAAAAGDAPEASAAESNAPPLQEPWALDEAVEDDVGDEKDDVEDDVEDEEVEDEEAEDKEAEAEAAAEAEDEDEDDEELYLCSSMRRGAEAVGRSSTCLVSLKLQGAR